MQLQNTRFVHLLAPLALLLGACVSSGDKNSIDSMADPGEWLRPSPLLAQQIADEAARLPFTHGIEHLELIRWFASVGEPAYPTMLELACDQRAKVAAAALAAMGATMDGRLVVPIKALECWGSGYERSAVLQLERSRALVRLGDWDAMPTLIEGLADDSMRVRALCDQALYEATRQRFGFEPNATPESRTQAIRHWEAWWLSRTGEGLLITGR